VCVCVCFPAYDISFLMLLSFQISKLLVVDTKKRYTAEQALAHPFFKREEVSSEVHDHPLIASVSLEVSLQEVICVSLNT